MIQKGNDDAFRPLVKGDGHGSLDPVSKCYEILTHALRWCLGNSQAHQRMESPAHAAVFKGSAPQERDRALLVCFISVQLHLQDSKNARSEFFILSFE